MNKQEAIEQVKNKALHHCGEKECYKDGCEKSVELNTALEIINQINEPKKVVIPKFVAEWIEKCKEAKRLLYNALEENDEVNCWLERDEKIRENEDTFVRAWLDDYEVEKEKLYTARLKGIAKEKESYVYKIIESGEIYLSDLVFIEEKSQVYFTQTELENLKYWNNPAFEIEEVAE